MQRQACRTISKVPFKFTTTLKPATMPILTRRFNVNAPSASASFHPLFRLLEDFDSYSQVSVPNGGCSNFTRTFNPKFDVREVEDGYELHGELPGVQQGDIEIQFTDSQTLSVSGKAERHYTSGTPPTSTNTNAIEEGSVSEKATEHQATVEDEEDYDKADAPIEEAKNNDAQVSDKGKEKEVKVEQPKPTSKYWVSERSIGSFSRTFSFSKTLDHDNVRASMKDGVLSIFVPKKEAESRKIRIE